MMDNSNIKVEKHNKTLENQEKEEKDEIGGPAGLEPTRYGSISPEWEVKSRVSDF